MHWPRFCRNSTKAKKKLLIELLDPEVRHDIEMIASFDEDEIGSRMTTNCIIIREDLNVKQAMSSLIDQAAKNDNISTIFVVNAQQKFYGAIDLKNLIIAKTRRDARGSDRNFLPVRICRGADQRVYRRTEGLFRGFYSGPRQ